MNIQTIHSDAIEELKTLKLTSYVHKLEEFSSEKELIEEILSRASASSLLAYQSGTIDAFEFCEYANELRDFCIKYRYDFNTYCYSPADIGIKEEESNSASNSFYTMGGNM